ncbi:MULTISPECIES: EAL domain-containing protein [Halomonadaceae]|uniref:sensor domain-containing phosphodiesterase n=1 Tax=Halomonadaceae TaxID=28256 RepID=UPI0012A9D6F2|nr:EAL domain-containing protein [Halomonas sp. THAF12]MCO7234129.1 EAL domain-containing protein [Cobetia sp. Dlab-2-AX]MCO7237382.1 EAL domain-containing protein [Cobetia sp. Dlab-2-U]QFT84189.1 Phytochrome-like protein cph2 [Halomonas sp. THAF12]QFT86989.1 Phytochrome-like protein cph2 [Halomonas sp. THAF12]QFT87013.1 Phytochrome-like protein cph2 [Halomonas sp. THAF12]
MLNELALMEAQQDVHERIAKQVPLEETLDAIARWIEILLPDGIVAFMRFDSRRQTLSLIPSQRFSRAYEECLQAVPIGPDAASFGSAAFCREPVVTEDIRNDPRWTPFRDAADREGLRACWSNPVLTAEGELLGTFGIYFREPKQPTDTGRRRMKQAAALVALAILRDRDASSHRALSEWHRSLFVNHPDGVYEFDLEGHFQRGNAALTRITGYPEDALIGRHFNEFIEPEYRELTLAGFDIARQGGSHQYETMGTHRDGHPYRLEILNFPVSVDGEVVGVYGVCRDITARKQEEEDRLLLERGIQATPNGVVMADATQPDMPLVYANEAFYRLTGYTPLEVLGRNCRFLQGPDTDPEALAVIRRAIIERQSTETTLRNYHKDGTPFWNHLSLSPVFDADGACTHYIGIQQDITRQREQEAQIAHQATHDLLTGLPNRTAFDEHLQAAFERVQEDQGLLVVMHLDLDGFKAVNDGLGYHIGNQLLVAVSERLRQVVDGDASLARMTGDEFALLLPGLDSRQAGVEMAEDVLSALAQPFLIEDRALHISASIGIACNCESVAYAYELMQRADLAVGDAKQQGRNTWYWYQGDQHRGTEEAVLLRHDLHTALRQDQFELYYQPIVEAVNGRIRGMEALIRWHHPERGMISPGVFIPLAEQTGQIIPLGRWILRRACQDAAAMRAAGGLGGPVAVNISSLQFRRDGFLADVKAALDDADLPPELLELEVTESVLLDGAEQAITLINELKALGIRVALDDFGTGFSSLSYLRDLPIHKVKLDRAFIQDIATSRSNAAIVQGIITMAHHLDLTVVAEGIEEREQQQDLIRRNCDLLQGFYFARPMPREAIIELTGQLPVPVGL